MTLPDDLPQTRYAKSGDLHIAYRVFGDGPFDVVVVPPLMFSMELSGNEPHALAAFRRLSSRARVIQFDKRGTGSSDRVSGAPSLEQRMDDVRAVMDAADSKCAALVGSVDGGSMSVLFAATYPTRTVALALFRPKPRYVRAPGFPWGLTAEEYDRETDELLRRRSLPERERFALMAQHMADWGETLTWEEFKENSRMWRMAMGPGALLAMRQMNREIDVRAVLPAIHVPTLLMHRAADAPDSEETADIPMTRYVAEQIPHAQVVEVPARGDWYDAMLPPLEGFLPYAWSERQRLQTEPRRVLATVLFTDLVDSAAKAAELGPQWQTVLRDHNAAIRHELGQFRGREIDTAGDGFFASGFDGPARAISCARAIRDAVGSLGLGVRVGVHTGECDIVDGKLAGLAVTIGARVAAQAEEGEVLVSGTVKDLVAGSGITFEPRGIRELKGLGEWPLYAVAAGSDEQQLVT